MRPWRLPFRRSALLLALAAALHGLLYIPLVSTHDETDTWTYVASANALRDLSYTTPLQAGFYFVYGAGWFDLTGARVRRVAWPAPERQAFRPPGYPLYLALFGEQRIFFGERLPVLLGQAALFAVGTFLLIASVRRWFDERAALAAGALYALDPWSKRYISIVHSETLAATLALATAYAFTRAWESGRARWWAATGALAASLALVRAVFVLAVPLALAAAALARGTGSERLARTAATGVAALALLVPWLAWTNHVVGTPTMQVWGEGYNLVLAASGEGHGRTAGDVEADPSFQRRMDRVRAQVPPAPELLRDPTAHPRYLRWADGQLRTAARRLYRERFAKDPLRVAWENAYRMWFLWNAHNDWYQPGGAALLGLRAIDWVLLVLAVAGAALAVVRGGGAARGAVAFLAAYTVVLGTHHVEARFGIPLRGIFLALAAVTLVEAASRFGVGRGEK